MTSRVYAAVRVLTSSSGFTIKYTKKSQILFHCVTAWTRIVFSKSSRAKLWEFCFPLYDRPDRDKFVCSSPSDFRIPGKSNCILSN